MNFSHFMLNQFQIGVVVFICIAVVAHLRKNFNFPSFSIQYLSTCALVFAKNGAKQSIAIHCGAKARCILEQLLQYFIPLLKHLDAPYIILCNSATVAC